MDKKAFIFINGNLSDMSCISLFLQTHDYIICADGGTEHTVKLGLIPNVIIGDMDSISSQTKKKFLSGKTEFITYPKEKDFTDSELAIKYALEKKFDEIIIVGLLGDRLDHFLANISHIAQLTKGHKNIRIIEGKQHIYFVYNEITIQGKINEQLSLIPLYSNCEGITTEGLQYKLEDETLPLGSTRGISNIFEKEEIKISVKNGVLITIHTLI